MLYELQQSFDCVDYEMLWTVVKDMSVPQHLIDLMHNLYYEQEAMLGQNLERQNGFL